MGMLSRMKSGLSNQLTTSYPHQSPMQEEDDEEDATNINYGDALANLQKIMKVEKQGLKQMEAENEMLRGANNRSMNTTAVSRTTQSLKSSRKNVLEEDRKVNKLKVENQLLNEKLKVINFQMDEFVKEQIQLSKPSLCNVYRDESEALKRRKERGQTRELLHERGQPAEGQREAHRPGACRARTATDADGAARESKLHAGALGRYPADHLGSELAEDDELPAADRAAAEHRLPEEALS